MTQATKSGAGRIAIPRSLRRPIKVRISGGNSDRLQEYLAHTPLRVGYGQDCDVRLDGDSAEGHDTVFELLPVDGPTKLLIPARFHQIADDFDVSIDGEDFKGSMRELRPGTKVKISDRNTNQHVDLIVDEPPYWVRKRKSFVIVTFLAVLSALIYGGYLLRSIGDANERISQTELRLSQTELRNQEIESRISGIINRVDSSQVAVDAALDEIRLVQRESQTELKVDFAERLRQITSESQQALSNLALEDTKGREALARETSERVSALRQDVSEKLVNGMERFKALEEQVYRRHAGQLESLAVHESRFKRILPVASQAVLYVKSEFTAVSTVTGETQTFDSSGTAFLVSDDGIAVTPLHVLEPWRFDEDFLALHELGVIELEPHSVKRHVWLAGEQIIDLNAPEEPLYQSAFSEGNTKRNLMVLHKPVLDTVTKLVVTPLGITEIQKPMPGPTDLAVFQLIDFSARYPHLTLATDDNQLQPLDKVLVIGFPLGRLDTGRSIAQGVMGSVRRVDNDLLELDTALHPGISGAPVLDEQARVVGMAIAVFGTVSYGVSVSANRISQAISLARERITSIEQRLERNGCNPGPVDGSIDEKTWNATQKSGCEFK